MRRPQDISATIVSIALIVSLAAAGAAFGAGVAGANHPDDAPDLSEYADFRVNFPYATDHYPGDKNEENGSIEYYASGADAFAQQDAEEGVYIDWIIVHAEYEGEDWIDYSACSTDNTKAFGIDRGNNNSGTRYDEGLVQKQKRVQFRDDGIIINFYNWEDIGGNPPYMAPEDAIVAAQGAGSSGGPCLTLTNEPGWYRIASFMNGTVADNGRNEEPSEDAKRVSLELNSNNYLYVCECDSREEAEEQLGQPPGSGGSTPTATPSTPTATETPTPTQTDADPGSTETPESGTSTATSTDVDSENTETATPATTSTDDGPGGDNTGDDGNLTPTPGGGPGFTGLAALIALLAAALLVRRRG